MIVDRGEGTANCSFENDEVKSVYAKFSGARELCFAMDGSSLSRLAAFFPAPYAIIAAMIAPTMMPNTMDPITTPTRADLVTDPSYAFSSVEPAC